MHKWLWLCLIVASVVWLSGCGGSSDPPSPTEGAGVITADDFNPFPVNAARVDLQHYTLPSNGTFVVTLTAGPALPALANPWLMVFTGRVPQSGTGFMAAYDGVTSVLVQDHGAASAHVTFSGIRGDEFTFAFSSITAGLGAYNWDVVKQ